MLQPFTRSHKHSPKILIIETLVGCSLHADKRIVYDIDKIKITLEKATTLPDGISYLFKLKNNTDGTLQQNAVYLSYPIKTANGTKGNNFKIEAKGNKLDIKPTEEVQLSFFAPKESFDNDASLDIEHPQLEIEGFMNEVKTENHFQKVGSLQFFN